MSNRELEPSNFEDASLDRMRGWTQGGAGADPLFSKAEAWRNEEKFMRALAERVKARLRQAHAVTESQGNEAMQQAMSPVTLWTEVAADNALAESERMREQGEAFARVQSSIPKASEEVEVPEENVMGRAWAGLTGGKTDNEVALAKNEKLRQEGVTAFNSYDNVSQTTVAAAPVFTAPPPGGLKTGVRSGPHEKVGPVDSGLEPGGTTTQSAWSNTAVSHSGTGTTTSATADSSQSSGRTPGTNPATRPAGTAPQFSNYDRTSSRLPWQSGTLDPRHPQGGVTGGLGRTGTPGRTSTPGNTGTPGRTSAPGRAGAPGRGSVIGRQVPIRGLNALGTGPGTGSGPGAGTGRGPNSGVGRPLGPGGQSGVGTTPKAGTSTTSSVMSGRSATSGMATGAAPRGGQQQGSEDEVHETPDYLRGDYGYFDPDLPPTAPPVIGDDSQ